MLFCCLVHELARKTKVNQIDLVRIIVTNNDVIKLQIVVYKATVVKESEALNQLYSHHIHCLFGECLAWYLLQHFPQITPLRLE